MAGEAPDVRMIGAQPARDDPVPLVGREHPLGVLRTAWAQAKAGQGKLIVLSGAAGIGKTRLAEEVARDVERGYVAWGRCHGGEGTPVLWPWTQVLRALAPRGLDAHVRAALRSEGFEADDLAPLVPEWASAPPRPAAGDAREARFRLFHAASALVTAVAASRPVLVVLDDLQLADAISLQVLDVVAGSIVDSPVLVVATLRDEPPTRDDAATAVSALVRRPAVHRIVLDGLRVDDVAAFVAARAGGHASAELVLVLYERTRGNPLLLDELVRLVVADGALHDPGRAARMTLPGGVRDILEHRLARLPDDVKAVLQIAAVIGHEFPLAVLEQVAELAPPTLQAALETAAAAGVVETDAAAGSYRFKQPLVRETLYRAVAAADRASLHAGVGAALVDLHADDDAFLAQIAHHLYEGAGAGVADEAFEYALRAADHAVGRQAYDAAELQLRKALRLVRGGGPERARLELTAQSRLTNLLISTRGYAAPEVREAAARARELCDAAGGAEQLVSSLFRLSMFHCVHGEFRAAQDLAEQMLQAGRAGDDALLLLGGHAAAGVIAIHRGEPARALDHLKEVERRSDQVCDAALITHPPPLYWRFFSAIALALRGDCEQARQRADEAVSLAQRIGGEQDCASAFFFDAWVAALEGDAPAARARAAEALAVSESKGFQLWEAMSRALYGWAVAEQGDPKAGIRDLNLGIAAMESTGARILRHFYLALLARAHIANADLEEALAAAEAGLGEVQAFGERFYEAELHRLRGQVLAAASPGRALEAEASLRTAIEVASAQGAAGQEQRARESLDELLGEPADGPPTVTPMVRRERRSVRSEEAILRDALTAYDIGEELGRGAAGVVLAGRHRRLGREVAIKQLWSGFGAESDIRERFLAEARVLASLDHPHVVQIYDYVEAEGLCILIMERLTGGSVQDRLSGGGVTPQRACAIVVAACAGLEYAHGRGVLHRDVKPQNLLLSADGRVKVADFGIAKVLAASTRPETQTGLVLGTPAYMAPEQVEGGALSPAVDVYAAGIVLYELLCGKLPFPVLGEPFAEMYQRVHNEPVPLLERAPRLPRELAEVTARALRRDPAERFAGAEQLAAAVAAAAERAWGPDWMFQLDTPPAVPVPEPAPRRRTLERDRELAQIEAALDGAAAGSGRLVVIEGPPGIGKTHLVEHARELAKSRGFGRLTATGYETETALAWGVVRQLVERSVLRYSGDVRERILAGPAGRALAVLDRAPRAAAANEAALAPTLHALWWVAADLSALRPLLITVDDAHWADRSSLRFLAYLARRIGDLAVAVFVATRATAADAGLQELPAGPTAARLLPRPLSQEALAALAAARGATPAATVARALHEATGGNPLHAEQVLDELQALGRSLEDPGTAAVLEGLGPASIARTMLDRLGPDALTVAKVIAIAGSRDGPAVACRLEVDPRVVATAIDELVGASVLSPADDLEFAHPVVREAVVAATGRAQRAAIHTAAAQDLAERGAAPDRVAAHVVMAPPGAVRDAATWLRAAAQALLAAGDAANATAYLRRAAEEVPQDAELAAELGEALLRAGEPAEAREHLRGAAQRADSPMARARWLAAAASATLALEGASAAAAELRYLLASGEGSGDDTARVLLEAQLAGVCTFDPDEFRRWGEGADRFADLPGDTYDERTLLAALARRGWADVRPASEVAALARRALGDGGWIRAGAARFAALGGALHTLVMADDMEAARRELQLAERAVGDGAPGDFVRLMGCRAILAWREGDVTRVAADAVAAADALDLADRDAAVAGIHAVTTRLLVLALLETGDVAGARAALEAYDAAAARDRHTIPRERVRYARGALALAGGDPELARAEAEALGAAERSAGADNPSVPWRALAALAAARAGDERGASQLAARQLELANAWGAASDLGAALRLAAAVDHGRRLELLPQAVEVLERSPAQLELAHALYDLGRALQDNGPRAEARELLRRADDLARSCGAVVLRARAHNALAALGDRARKPTLTPGVLTPSERRVAELAARGRSDREIAQELFVTPRAVESHLDRICSKLGLRSRSELSTALPAV